MKTVVTPPNSEVISSPMPCKALAVNALRGHFGKPPPKIAKIGEKLVKTVKNIM